jgi:hypothetical protein
MPNMSYCRMQNTVDDLEDCAEHWEDATSADELQARARILRICQEIVNDYGVDD